MIMIVDVKPEHRASLPAITHVNGSARTQTVSVPRQPGFLRVAQTGGCADGPRNGAEHQLQREGTTDGQHGPREAVETFLGTGIDALFLEHALITRR